MMLVCLGCEKEEQINGWTAVDENDNLELVVREPMVLCRECAGEK